MSTPCNGYRPIGRQGAYRRQSLQIKVFARRFEQALGPLIDAFLQGQPPGMANFPAGQQAPDFQPHKHEWQSLFEHSQGNACGHTPEVPEPESYALMLAGLGMLAAVGKRLRDKGTDA